MKFKPGNYLKLVIGPCKDGNGDTITNLGDAESVIFAVKENKSDSDSDAILYADLDSGITVNSPSSTYITVEINDDSVDDLADYESVYMGLQITFPDKKPIEFDLTESTREIKYVTVKDTVVRGET